MLLDVHGTRFDDLHGPKTTASGVQLEGSPIRKAVNEQQAAEYLTGLRNDKGTPKPQGSIGGDVGLRGNTEGQSAQRASGTLGLDYDHSSNKYFDPATNQWTDMVSKRGLPVVDTQMTPAMHDKATVPLGTDATAMLQAEAQRRAAAGEYVPELMKPKSPTELAHVTTRDRTSQIDPRVGWGFSASERAIDPSTGKPWSVVPNQELNIPGFVPLGPSSSVSVLPPAAAVAPGAVPKAQPLGPVGSPAPGTAPVVDPNLPPFYQQTLQDHLHNMGFP
jgi:hypothetical protein